MVVVVDKDIDSSLGLENCSVEEVDASFKSRVLERYTTTRVDLDPFLNEVVPTPNMKWLYVSAMQKAIRLGHREEAARYAVAVWKHDASYCVRRMTVIALEDIGIANLALCGEVLSLVSSVAWVRSKGSERLIAYMAYCMAGSVKSRGVCDLACCWMLSSEAQGHIKRFVNAESYVGLGRFMPNKIMGDYVELAAARGELPEPGKRRSFLMSNPEDCEALTEGFSAYSRYLLVKGRKAQPDTLHIGLAVWLNHEMAGYLDSPRIAKERLLNEEYIGGLPAPAYDQHTHQGKKAIRTFCNSCPDVMAVMRELNIPRNLWAKVVGSAIFEREGAQLDREVKTVLTESAFVWNHKVNSQRYNMTTKDMNRLYDIIAVEIPLLNSCRSRVVGR